jgi:penicillin amidase
VTASLPGVPLFPTGSTGSRSWSYLLGTQARLTRIAPDSTRIRTRHERITPVGGDEHLVTIRRHGADLLVAPAPPDSAWVLKWPGLQARTDLPRWLAHAGLRADAPPLDSIASAFRLFRGSGLTMDAAGAWTVRGRPPVVERGPGMVLVGRSSWARHQADGLRARKAGAPLHPDRWSVSDSSTWAAALLPRLLPDLAPLEGTDPVYDDALSYLRNWEYVYEPASIGAVVFERWMQACRAEIGPVPPATDSLLLSAPRRRQTFRRAVDQLADRYGTDVRQWRWERVTQNRRYFPVWSSDSLVAADLSPMSTTQFAPLDRPGRGHASTLAGGPTLVDPPSINPAPARWDGWMRSGEPALTVRRLRFDPSAFFARSLLSRERPAPVSVSEAPIQQTTQLVPVEPERR